MNYKKIDQKILQIDQKALQIDQRALQITQHFKRCEADLLNVIIEVDDKKVFRKMGYASLFQYVVHRLGLSEALAYNFINVARKAQEVPELKKTIERGELTVCKAKKITSVLNNKNQKHWLNLARSETQRKIEREVALAQPHKSMPERLTYVSPTIEIPEKVQVKSNSPKVKLELGLSERLMLKLRRAQDLISQKQRQSVGLETAIEVMVNEFLAKNDPMEKAKRQVLKGRLKQGFSPENPENLENLVNLENLENLEKLGNLDELKQVNDRIKGNLNKQPHQSARTVTNIATSKASPVQVARTVNLQNRIQSQCQRETSTQVQTQNKRQTQIQTQIQTQVQTQRKPLPASLKHRVYLRDQGECTARDESGQKCRSQRFLEIHHILELSQGGKDELENLTLLCSGHHKALHDHGRHVLT